MQRSWTEGILIGLFIIFIGLLVVFAVVYWNVSPKPSWAMYTSITFGIMAVAIFAIILCMPRGCPGKVTTETVTMKV